jgi:outer membrane receptor protein involved in Fe transport
VYQVLVGFRGSLPIKDWTWDIYASQGGTTTDTALNGGFASLQRYREIIQAPFYGQNYARDAGNGFTIRCTSGLSPFSNTPVSQDCLDAVGVNMKNHTDFEQQVFEANLQGGLFNLPTGEVRAAFGASYRKDTVNFSPDSLLSTASVDEQPIGLYAVSNTKGATTVKEIYGELLVPILHDLPAVKALELELGGRYSDYNTAGGQNTWKALANWTMTDYLSFRGGVQRAARAPNTAELFSGQTLNVVGFAPGDPCATNTQAPYGNVASNPNRAKVQALCSAMVGTGTSRFDQNPNTYTGPFGFFPYEIEQLAGNTKLEPEIARTWTLGAVFRSPFENPLADKLTASLDWYHITIDGEIAPIDPVTTYALCLNANGTSNPTYSLDDPGGFCRFIDRDPITGDRHSVDAPFLNLGGLKTSGIDLQLNWRANLSDLGLGSVPGSLSVNYLINYLDSFQTQASPGAPFLEYVGTVASTLGSLSGQYRWRSFMTIGYLLPTVNAQLTWRHLPSAEDGSVVTNPLTTIRGLPSYDIFSLSAGWEVSDTLSIRGGVDNLFDKQPPVAGANPPITNNASSTYPNYYDVLGRRYYLGLKVRF